MSGTPTLDRARALVLRHGWNSTAYQILNPGIQHWFSADGDGVVGYVETAGTRVVAGEPIGPRARVAAIAAAFEHDAAERRLRVCYFCTGEDFAERARTGHRHAAIWIGAQPVWDPSRWADRMQGHKSLRAQLRRATNKGVSVEEWPHERASESQPLHDCLAHWVSTRPFAKLHFLVEPETLGRLFDRRVFVATRGETIVGFVVASPVAERNGWLIEQIVRAARAPNGTAALLVNHAVTCFDDEGASFVTMGLAPLSRRAGIEAHHPPLLGFLLRWVRAHGERFYHFSGLDFFKAKFRPDRWEPVYASSAQGRFSLRMLYAVGSAFSGGSPWLALARTLSRGARQELSWVRESRRS